MPGVASRDRFSGRRVLVTGASSGIGRATAVAFAAEGARVTAAARREGRLHALVRESHGLPGTIDPAVVDVRDRAALRELVSCVASKGIDVLVNNAGVAIEEPLLETTDEHFDDTIATNLAAAFAASQEAARHMVAEGKGAIVNVASIDAFVAESPFSAYCASKAALVMLTRCLAFELGHLGVRCNAVCPGMTLSEMTEDLSTSFVRYYLPRIPLRRFAAPEEQAQAILFLASDEASFVNGATLDVDGGQRAGFWYSAADGGRAREVEATGPA
ncbi:MAG: SDR family NAD(P)-dependent oxidoreductase [Acidimicrobiales bacterium]